MNEHRLRVGIITGSIRQGRFGPVPARWITGLARQRGDVDVDPIDLADAALPQVLGNGGPAPEPVQRLGARLAEADAFIIVTPEYNHSIPGSLKNAIDWYVAEWEVKPVAFVSYGGIAGGLRAVQHLRQIFPSLHAVPIRDSVSFPNYWERFGDDGSPLEPEACGAAAKTMLDQLVWWARLLRDARGPHHAPRSRP
jgi:NAD(P)H-dependent FMN reductase